MEEWQWQWKGEKGGVIVIMAVFLVDVNWYQKFSMFN